MSGIHPAAPSLRELQRRVAAQVRAGDPRPPAALDRWLAVPPGERVATRLAVYVDGYPARLHDALRETFPAVARLLGAARFHALVHRYLRCATLPSYNLNDAGAELPAALAADPLGAELPFLADLAALEWALARAYHARQPAPLTVAELAALAPAAILASGVRWQPSLALCASAWPIHALWAAREAPPGAIDIDLTVAERVVVWRCGLAVECALIDAERAAVLDALRRGAAVGAAVAQAADPAAAIGWLGEWIAAGMVDGMECGA